MFSTSLRKTGFDDINSSDQRKGKFSTTSESRSCDWVWMWVRVSRLQIQLYSKVFFFCIQRYWFYTRFFKENYWVKEYKYVNIFKVIGICSSCFLETL